MSRVALITGDASFAHRTRLALAGMPGTMDAFTTEKLPASPDGLLGEIEGGMPQAVIFGPGNDLQEALRLAAAFDVQHPTVGVVLVHEPDPSLAMSAMRSGIRDILDPGADPDTIRVMLERVCRSSAGRCHSIAAAAPGAAPQEEAGRIIVVTGAKGGIGKTTLAANLAVGLGRVAPMSTVLVDLDAQFGDVATVLGIEPEHTLKDAVAGAAAQDRMVLKTLLSVHPASVYALCAPDDPAEANRIGGEQVTRMLRQLASEFRYVVVDTAPGLGEHALAALEAATDMVLLCGMDVPSVRGARKELDVLGRLGMRPARTRLVVNQAVRDAGLSLGDIEATLGLPVELAVPRSSAVEQSTDQGEPLLHGKGRDKAAKALLQLVDRFDPDWESRPRKGMHRRAVTQ